MLALSILERIEFEKFKPATKDKIIDEKIPSIAI